MEPNKYVEPDRNPSNLNEIVRYIKYNYFLNEMFLLFKFLLKILNLHINILVSG